MLLIYKQGPAAGQRPSKHPLQDQGEDASAARISVPSKEALKPRLSEEIPHQDKHNFPPEQAGFILRSNHLRHRFFLSFKKKNTFFFCL